MLKALYAPAPPIPLRGERAINEAEALIVRRIYREFAAGRSPRTIAPRHRLRPQLS
jgi:hypothetical protein